MLEWRSYVVGTCHGMSPEAILMRSVALADMPWHVPTTMCAFLKVALCHGMSILQSSFIYICSKMTSSCPITCSGSSTVSANPVFPVFYGKFLLDLAIYVSIFL